MCEVDFTMMKYFRCYVGSMPRRLTVRKGVAISNDEKCPAWGGCSAESGHKDNRKKGLTLLLTTAKIYSSILELSTVYIYKKFDHEMPYHESSIKTSPP